MRLGSAHVCIMHNVQHTFDVDAPVDKLHAGLVAWQQGAFIQDALPMLDANQQEILMTGTCQEAWDSMLSEKRKQMKTELEALAEILNNIMNCYHEDLAVKVHELNERIAKIAMHEAGVTAADLADENQESTPRIRLYWTLTSLITSKVYMCAAQKLTHYRELDL